MPRPVVWLDTETRNDREIKYGTFQYAETCKIDVFSWALDDGDVYSIDLQTCPAGDISVIRDLLNEAPILIAHNAMFDRNVLALGDLKIATPIHKWRCTMVHALAHALPGGLEKLGPILGLPEDKQKLKEGRALMRLFCKPRPRNCKERWATALTHPEQRAKYVDYCAQDVIAMREIAKRLPAWNMAWDFPINGEEWTPAHTELAHYHRDQRMNARGYAIDMPLVRGALRAVDAEQARLQKRCQEATNGEVQAATQRDKLLAFLVGEYGIKLPDLKGSTLDKVLLDETLDPGLRNLLTIRQAASTTSTAKYQALARGINNDGRLRGTIQMNGAGRTRRAAGRTFQPQNLMRPTMKAADIELGIRAIKLGGETMLFENVMDLAANSMRGTIVAGTGRKLVAADLSNIEGRGLAWCANEVWKLDAFRAFDAGLGPDIYKTTYGRSFGLRPEDVTPEQRQVGKVQELACGYGGSINAFISFSLIYNIDLNAMAEAAWPTLDDESLREAEGLLQWFQQKRIKLPALPEKTLVVILCLVYGWRNAHPRVVALWKGLEAIWYNAACYPGEVFTYEKFKAYREGAWLRLSLPSGRFLCYPSPQVDERGKLSYMGVNQYTRQWSRLYTYGGKLSENVVQSLSRDIFYDSQPWVEMAGYNMVLHVHDEDITETPDEPEYTAKELAGIMTRPPSWRLDGMQSYAHDFPLAATGFESRRYRKA